MNNENDDQTKDDAATNESPCGSGLGALPCSADLLRAEASRIQDIRAKAGENESGPLAPLAWALNVSAAWLDSLSAPERQTRYVLARHAGDWIDAETERPEEGEWVLHTYAGVRAPEYGLYNLGRFWRDAGPESFPATHWLPVPCLALPNAERSDRHGN